MKKIIFFIVVMFSMVAFSQAKLGFRAGVNLAKITGDNSSTKTDFYAGAMLNVHLSDLYELQPELTYSRQGGSYDTSYNYYDSNIGSNVNSVSNIDVELNYISIGLTNKFFILKDEKLHLLIGPSVDFNFKNNLVSVVNGNYEIDYTPIDVSFYGGIGYQFDFGLTLEARYKHGLLDIDFDNDDIYNSSTGKYESSIELNSVIQFGASYRFDFSKKED